ncbi:MAG: phage portal protein [Ktedonobacterales bacterium]|nr:phage portal protein [Ktedonobacterales bacterium]
MASPLPSPEQNFSRRTWRHAVAGTLDTLSRRILPQQAARSYPLPERLTHSTQQAAHAARIQQQAARQNNAGRRLPVGGQRQGPGPQRPDQSPNMSSAPPDAPASVLNAGAFDQQMQVNQAPQAAPVPMYAPGAPLPVTPNLPPVDGPRQFEYPIGYNITPQPRTTEMTSFAQLRGLAFAYYGIRLCERAYFDVIAGLDLKVTFKENVIPDGESEGDPKWRAIAAPAEAFLTKPDGVTDFTTWLTASVRDVLELGHAFIYKRRNRAGRIIALDWVDAATVKPLMDERGRMPLPPYPAYEQYLYGVPAYYLSNDEVEWIRESGRTDSVYATSRVEDIIINVNAALQKQALDLARYTDGAMPQGFITTPADSPLTVQQIEAMEQAWNGLLAGNSKLRVRTKFLMPGQAFQASNFGQNNDPLIEFDRFLLNTSVAAFGLTMDELGMTDTSNKSVGQSQQSVVYRRTVKPLVSRHAKLLTAIIQQEFDPRLVVTFVGYEEEEDQLIKAQTLDIGVKNGSLSPSRMARMMGWAVDLEVPPMVVTKDGPVWLEDALELRKAQLDAQRAGLQFAAGIPGGGTPGGGTPGGGTSGGGTPGGGAPPPPPAPGTGGGDTSGGDTSGGDTSGGEENPPPKQRPQSPATKASPVTQQRAAGESTAGLTGDCCHAAGEPCPETCQCPPECACKAQEPAPERVKDEYRRWYTVATRAAKSGKRPGSVRFVSTLIPAEDYALLASDLAHCAAGSVDEVKATFARARARERVPVRPHRAADDQQPKPKPLRGVTDVETQRYMTAPATTAVAHASDSLSLRARAIFDEAAREGYHYAAHA